MTSTLREPTRMVFTIDHLHAMVDAGFFNPDDRVELIEGEIYVTPPPGEQHTTVSDRLDYHLRRTVGAENWVKPEATLQMPTGDLVTADLCVLDISPAQLPVTDLFPAGIEWNRSA